MPMYEYECTKCGERFEMIQKFSDDPIKVHAQNHGDCDGEVRKLLSAPAIQFKGSGWYVTDYGKGGEKPKSSDGETKTETKSESSKSDKSPKSELSKNGSTSKTSGTKSSD